MKKPKPLAILFLISPTLIALSVTFLYAIFLCMDFPIDAGLELVSRPSVIQKFQDTNNLKFLPPNRDGSDLSLPSELAGNTSIVILEPTMGKHRRHMDAVFSIAEGVELKALALFVITLRESHFIGDIVFSAPSRENMLPGVYDFLNYHSGLGLVVYEDVIEFEQYGKEYMSTDSAKVYLKGLYGDNITKKSFEDPRHNRHIGVARFELYWLWSTRYDPNSKILLIDTKNTYFQNDGTNGMGSGMGCLTNQKGNLHLYEGNKAISILNNKNQTMIPAAYSTEVLQIITSYPVLIPSSTHGNQLAIEAYLRAMVKQFDYTQCVKMYCEWAFHNYLYYFGVLQGAPGINHIRVRNQGTGSVNPLAQSEVLLDVEYVGNKVPLIYNKNKHKKIASTPSWAVHQYEQHAILKSRVDIIAEDIASSLAYNKVPVDIASPQSLVIIQPSMGSHRYTNNAIFTTGVGINLSVLKAFFMSIRTTGYKGDIVLSVSERNKMQEGVFEFLQSQVGSGLVVYEGVFNTTDDHPSKYHLNGMYRNDGNVSVIDDPRPARALKVAQFELFWAWSHNYQQGSEILLLNAADSYFKKIPFGSNRCPDKLRLQAFKVWSCTLHRMHCF